ncbi:aluminum-activated malate transporter 2-like isoform X2 [Chenopodium quinoa]|uniref:Aluminum-activated malate transporter n=1 Tax=Chenopodium quinoa TaxID=63459 RepID=A0A803KR92_CHEQI|nr:aluminum-activated malate transporter 2-like isoform X2 [Chenopodium quinoa]
MATMNVVSSPNNETKGGCTRACQYLKSLPKSVKDNVVNFTLEAKKLGQDDPRKIYHALKVGFAITVVSLFYYFQALYNGFGVSAMWAVITVVVVFEFTVGATLGKGLNRMISTCVAGFLGVVAHYLADLSGETGEPILLALFGFIVASILTFMRFFPKLKAKYDYGLMIFILTFALVAVSGYRDDEVIKIAQQRLATILIGSCIAMLICILISPVWTGAELHNLIASNMEKLGNFLEGFGSEYMTTKDEKSKEEKSFRQQYKSVLGTKSTEETMANFAFWEPSHGKFKFRHPWKQYLKIGALIRKCAYSIDALNNYLNPDILQTPEEIEEMMREACKKLSNELGKVPKEAAIGLKKMRKTSTPKTQLAETKEAAKELKRLLQDTSVWEKSNLLDVLPAVTVASILIDIVDCVESITEAVHELASMADFKTMDNEIVCPEKELSQIVVVGDVTDIDTHVPDHQKVTTSSAESETKTSH